MRGSRSSSSVVRAAARGVLGAVLLGTITFGVILNAANSNTAAPTTRPFLQIETEMHASKISILSVDAAQRHVVTASSDKTARIWDLNTGALEGVLRPPQGNLDEGELWAVAMSPDGTTIAVAGQTGFEWDESYSVYVFDRETRQMITRIRGLPESVCTLSYSRDGNQLVAGLRGKFGIRVFRTNNYQEIFRDSDYDGSTQWTHFDATGRLVTTSDDGYVRLYGADQRLLKKKRLRVGSEPYMARFSPDGLKIAVSFETIPAIAVVSSADLTLLYNADTSRTGNKRAPVAWSADGSVLYAGTMVVLEGSEQLLYSWADSGRGTRQALRIASNTIADLQPLADGRIVFAAADPEVGVLDARQKVIWQHLRQSPDFRGNESRLTLSSDGSVVDIPCMTFTPPKEWQGHVARFSLASRQLLFDPPENAFLHPPRTTGLDIHGWNDGTPKLRGRTLYSDDTSRALAVSKAADRFLLGNDFTLRLFNRDGKELWSVPVSGGAWAVNLSADGRFAVAALGDGTVRWYDTKDGGEVLALFIHRDRQRWVTWTPEGFFDAPPGGTALIGYHLNHGPDRAGEFIAVVRLFDLFYRPDIVAERLEADGGEVAGAALARIGDITTVLGGGLPPELERLSPAESQSEGDFVLSFRATDRDGGIGRIVYRVDGIESAGREVGIPLPGSGTLNRRFELSPGRHEITTTVYNARNQVESRSISAIVNVAAHEQRPALFVVAAGISHYQDSALDEGVKYASTDAKSVVERFQVQGRDLFSKVTPYVLYDRQATRTGIEQAIAKVASQIHSDDVFVLYLAGHGAAFDGQYYYIPWEVLYTSNDALRKQSLDQEALRTALAQISAKKTLVLLDTCSSAAYSEGRTLGEKASIDRFAKITGRATLAAATQTALEGVENHGVFTYAVLEALSKVSDAEGLVKVTQLADYVMEVVPKITEERFHQTQVPMWIFQGQTFPIARKP